MPEKPWSLNRLPYVLVRVEKGTRSRRINKEARRMPQFSYSLRLTKKKEGHLISYYRLPHISANLIFL